MWTGRFGANPNPVGVGARADWVFTSRSGGVSRGVFESLNLAAHVGDEPTAVDANRRVVAQLLGTSQAPLAAIRAEHGNRVHEVTPDSVGSIPIGDGLVSVSEGVTLLALAADCAPVLLADTTNRVIGVVHCGWRGVVAGVVTATVDRMLELGAEVSSVAAIVGPSICGQCYVVSADCAHQIAAAVPGSSFQDSGGQWHVDVPGAVLQQLGQRGIASERIPECTFTNPELFSYRRDGITGRQGAAIVLRSLGGAA